MHAATFGGNPIAARAGIAAIEMIENESLLENVERISELFRTRLEAVRKQNDAVRDLRILGMMIGIELTVPGAAVVEACLKRRLLRVAGVCRLEMR
jgi:acetylornithine/succinyldiaminopimelate/putrescine aminotransferase